MLPASEIIKSATLIGAELVGLQDKVGTIKVGAHADIIAVNGNPLADISLLTGQGENIPFVMKGGATIKYEGRPVLAC